MLVNLQSTGGLINLILSFLIIFIRLTHVNCNKYNAVYAHNTNIKLKYINRNANLVFRAQAIF